MKIKDLALILTLGAATLPMSAYTVKLNVPAEMNGSTAYIIDYDTSANIDSTTVDGGTATFKGRISEPVAARIIIDGNRMSQFILEDDDITIDRTAGHVVNGGRLNELNNSLNARIGELSQKLREATDEAAQEAIYAEYNALTDSVMNANLTNPVGYLIFLDKAYEFEPAELEKFVADNPYFAKYQRVQKLLENNRNKLATSEGSKFKDFEIEYEGVTHRLSDVVGKGDYVLVDFWASWCGPCIAQTKVLKDIYKEHGDALKILGVAVWDEPANTKEAIVKHELPWESWLNGQNVPTDVYGISGIPCIILFGPDGTILSRDKQSDELKAAVAKALNNK